MSDERKDGGPAFPASSEFWVSGMSLRDYYAGQAMAAYMRDMSAKPRDERCACGWYVKADCPEAKGERCYKADNARHAASIQPSKGEET